MIRDITLIRTIAALAACAALVACSKSGDESKPVSQVAVKVNKDEITVHQVNQVLSRAGRLSPEQAKVAGKQAVEQLIDQQLLIQKAVETKLDRTPDVVAALEAARRQVLAQAYMERTVSARMVKPTPEEIKKYYDSKPELFAERRIYRLQEIVASVPEEQAKPLLAVIGKTKNLNDVVAFLKTNDLKYNANSAVRPAEQLPLDLVPVLAKMNDGDIGALGGNGRFTIVQRVAAPLTPLTLEEASPQIEQFLGNKRRGELAGEELKQLRQVAKLEYVGEFTAPATAQAPAAGDAAKAVPSAAVVPAKGPGGAAPGAAADGGFEKGLKGIR